MIVRYVTSPAGTVAIMFSLIVTKLCALTLVRYGSPFGAKMAALADGTFIKIVE